VADSENKNFEFGIENFKPYADLQSIELGKITLIYGSNSSGKTSFIQSFLCAAQSSESSDCSLSLNGEFVECGTFDSVLNRKIGDTKKEVVLKLSRSFTALGSLFSIEKDKTGKRIKNIEFHLNLQIQIRSFFSKSSTPGVLDISRIQLILPQINCFKDSDLGIQDAWLLANRPLPGTNELHYLEDTDGDWMSRCIETIRFIAEDLKQCLEEIGAQQSEKNQGAENAGYTIRGDYSDLNLLYCASLSIGAWLTVMDFDLLKNTFAAYIFPSSMPYLEGEYFSNLDLAPKIKDLHDKLREYYFYVEECSRRSRTIKYSLGDEYNASWSAIPVLDQSVQELLEAIEDDSNCITIKNKILALTKDIQNKMNDTTRLGSSLMSDLAEYSQRLFKICRMLDISIAGLREIIANSITYNGEKKESDNTRERDVLASQHLTRLYQHADESISCLVDSFRLLTSMQSHIGLDVQISNNQLSFSELNSSIDECKQIYNELKKIFGSLRDIDSFLMLTARLSDRARITQQLIASKANDLDYVADSGKHERSAIEHVKGLMKDIERFLKTTQINKFSAVSSRSRTVENMWKLTPVLRSIEILPPNILKGRVLHLGPDRPTPKRSYSINEIYSDSQLQHLPEWDSEREDLFPASHQDKYFKELACLGIRGDDIVRNTTSDPLLDKCSIGILSEKEFTNICDLGFGVSQVMPLVIASKIPDKDLIVVQQPETHLHPKMQADLGDLLIESIDTKRWLIETHSEVLMLRILRRIREKEFSASDLKIYFVDQRDGASRIIDMKFSDSGDLLTRWPKGFFAQESMEIF
jgi:hypothetical protein